MTCDKDFNKDFNKDSSFNKKPVKASGNVSVNAAASVFANHKRRCDARLKAMANHVARYLYQAVAAQDLSEAIDLIDYQCPVNRKTVCRLMLGKTLPRVSTLVRICSYLGLELSLAVRPRAQEGPYYLARTVIDVRCPRASTLSFARKVAAMPLSEDRNFPGRLRRSTSTALTDDVEPTIKTLAKLADSRDMDMAIRLERIL